MITEGRKHQIPKLSGRLVIRQVVSSLKRGGAALVAVWLKFFFFFFFSADSRWFAFLAEETEPSGGRGLGCAPLLKHGCTGANYGDLCQEGVCQDLAQQSLKFVMWGRFI